MSTGKGWTLPRLCAGHCPVPQQGSQPHPALSLESSLCNSRMGSANLRCYFPHQWLINTGSESKRQRMDFSQASPRRERGESLGAVHRILISSPVQMEQGWKRRSQRNLLGRISSCTRRCREADAVVSIVSWWERRGTSAKEITLVNSRWGGNNERIGGVNEDIKACNTKKEAFALTSMTCCGISV